MMKSFLNALDKTSETITTLSQQLAPFGMQCVRSNMINGTFKPNAGLTKNTKNGGAKPLFDTGETYASITYESDHKGYRVGTNKAHAPLINNGASLKRKKPVNWHCLSTSR